MANENEVRQLEEQLKKVNELSELRGKYNKKLSKERSLSAFEKAAKTFSFPFKSEAFDKLWTAVLALLVTIIFMSCSGFVVLAIIFCALVDVLYIPLFGIVYPFLLVYFALFKGVRIKRFERKLARIDTELSAYPGAKKIARELAKIEKERSSQTTYGASCSSDSGIRSTDYYEEKCDEYYRVYMGFPPKEGKTLSDLATDATLDLHPGDY